MVYVDTFRTKFRGLVMSHLMADTQAELDDIVQQLGLPSKWEHVYAHHPPCWDVSEKERLQAISLGAREVRPRDLIDLVSRAKWLQNNQAGPATK